MSRLPGHRESDLRKPTQLEKNFQAKVIKKLKTLRRTWFYKASDRVKNGIPDIIASIDGHFVALELKRGHLAKTTPLQAFTLGDITASGGISRVVYPENWDLIWDELVELAGGTK